MRRVALAALGGLLFVAFLLRLLPIDAVVRRALARATPPGGPAIEFARAELHVDGIHLTDVTVRAAAADGVVRLEDVRARPSLVGLVRDGSGLPWRLDTTACGGRLSARVEPDGGAMAVLATWEDGDLGACPFLPIAAGALAGRARGDARVRLTPAAWPEGEGRVELEAGRWEGRGRLQGFPALHAESASVRWTLQAGRLVLDAVELRGPDVSAQGSGAVDLVDPLPKSAVELTLALATPPDARGLYRLFIGPPGSGRRLRVGGTLGRPSAVVVQ